MLSAGGLPDPAALGAAGNPLLGMGLATGAAVGLPGHQQLMTGLQQPAGVLAMGGFAAQQPQGGTRNECSCVCCNFCVPKQQEWALFFGTLQTCQLVAGFCLTSCHSTLSGCISPAPLLPGVQPPPDLCSLLTLTTLQPPRATLACLVRQGLTLP